MSNVVLLKRSEPRMRQVLRGVARDAAVREAADWYHENQDADLNTIAARFNISMTASAGAILLAIGERRE